MTWRAFAPKSNGLATPTPRACPDAASDRTTRLAIRVANVSHAFMTWRLSILIFGVPAKYDPLFNIRYRHARGSFFNLHHSSLSRRLCAHECKRLHEYTQI